MREFGATLALSMIDSLIGMARRGRIEPMPMPTEKPMVPTLSERLRRRAYECYYPRHIRVPWQVSPELPTALLSLAAARVSAAAAARVSADAAVEVSPEPLAKSIALAQPNQALAQSNQPLLQQNQPQLQPIGPRQILQAAAGAHLGEGIAPNPPSPRVPPGQLPPSQELPASRLAAGQSSSQELVLLLVLSLLTLLDGAKALRHLLISTASVWRPSQRLSAALPTHSATLAAKRVIHQPRLSRRFHSGAEWIQQRLIFHLFGPGLLSRRR